MSVVSFLVLLFQYVNVLLPDPLGPSLQGVYDGIRLASSILLVSFGVFLLLSWLLEEDLRAQPAKRELRVRKWLVHFTLFLAALTIIVDLITLLNRFYGGEITARFLLKTLAVLLVAGTTFGYYLWDLRRGSAPAAIPRRFARGAAVVVVASIVAGFFIGGSLTTLPFGTFCRTRIKLCG